MGCDQASCEEPSIYVDSSDERYSAYFRKELENSEPRDTNTVPQACKREAEVISDAYTHSRRRLATTGVHSSCCETSSYSDERARKKLSALVPRQQTSNHTWTQSKCGVIIDIAMAGAVLCRDRALSTCIRWKQAVTSQKSRNGANFRAANEHAWNFNV